MARLYSIIICDCPSETSLIHTSKLATSEVHNFPYEIHIELKFTGLVEQYNCSNFQLFVTLLQNFRATKFGKIGGVNQSSFRSDSHINYYE